MLYWIYGHGKTGGVENWAAHLIPMKIPPAILLGVLITPKENYENNGVIETPILTILLNVF